MLFSLRPYQSAGKAQLSELYGQGYHRLMLVVPTGGGKTVTFADIARDAVTNGFTVGIAVDRKELLQQAHAKLNAYGLRPTLITAGTANARGTAYICTIQTLMRRPLPHVDLWIIDEAHKQIFDKLLQNPLYANSMFLGVTATPIRSGKMTQLASLYNTMVEPVQISDLIEQQFLSPAISYGRQVDVSNIKVKGGEFDADDMFNEFNKGTLYAGTVDNYLKYTPDTKFLCFCINREHSRLTAAAFQATGVNCHHLDGSTPPAMRTKLLAALANGDIDGLCNPDILTTGYDEWTIQTVIVNRATKSLPLWLQMCGRGSRITPHEYVGVDGYLQKTHFNIIDQGGNIMDRHGFWEMDREFSLSHKRNYTEGAPPVKGCPEDKKDPTGKAGCGVIVHASVMQCPECGYQWVREKKSPQEVEFGKIDNVVDMPEHLKKPYNHMTLEELMEIRKLKKYHHNWLYLQIELHPTLALEEYSRLKGHKDSWAYLMRKQLNVKKQAVMP